MERQRFEEEFKNAFDGAEVSPSDSVWTNIELDLEKKSGGKMKRRLLFFQLLAAASMVFAMGVGGVYYLNSGSTEILNTESLSQTTISPSTSSIPESTKVPGNSEMVNKPELSNTVEEEEKQLVFQKHNNNTRIKNTNSDLSSNDKESIRSDENKSIAMLTAVEDEKETFISRRAVQKERLLPSLVSLKKPEIMMNDKVEQDAGSSLLAQRKQDELKLKEVYESDKEEKIQERIWTSLGVAAGNFNPNSTGTTSSMGIRSFGSNASASNPRSGNSYAIGLSVAGKLSKRLLLQGGFTYLTQNANYTSSTAVGAQATLNELGISSEKAIATSPYQVENNLQYLSIPVQAGFIVLDKTFSIQLNGGVATDLFLQSTLTPSDNAYEKVSSGPGSDSPYRSVNFSGLVGTEFSYKVGDHYRIALNPGLRYALNSIYKSDIATQASPVTFDVALRCRYIF